MTETRAGSAMERALLLLQQRRFDMAEKELRQALAVDPDQFAAHAWLSLTLMEMRRLDEAVVEAEQAVHLAPDHPYGYSVLSRVLLQQNQFPRAEKAIAEAIRLNPQEADYFALLATIFSSQQQWAKALAAAEQGLALDAEHIGCGNLRAMALNKLGRRQESVGALDAALYRDPENALTHANQGWIALEQNDHQRAMTHFREALRLNPELNWARAGILEALKARNPIYRWLLQYFFWMSRMGPQLQWGVILGAYFGYQIVQGVARNNPQLAPFLTPLIILYVIFVYLTWTGKPLFNLLLRLDSFGRLVLTPEQIRVSTIVGALLGAAAVGWLIGWSTGFFPALALGLVLALLIIPVAHTLERPPGRNRTILLIYTAVLALVASLALGALLLNAPVFASLAQLFFLGIFAFGWIGNLLR
ncbi:MAG: tetratricopeptide repeat protein [Caldilineaceae bacterium]|nr:tetratricopeptide repeat protein [Caldilineaceae bacterium]